jgi:hypothetical protein
MTNLYKILIRKPEGKRPLGRPMLRCEDNIRMDIRKIGSEVVHWIHLAQDRNQWQVCEHRNEHSRAIKDGVFLDYLNDY